MCPGKVRSPKENRDKELSRAKKKADRHNIKKGGRETRVRAKAHVFCPSASDPYILTYLVFPLQLAPIKIMPKIYPRQSFSSSKVPIF